ncbi:LOW QUALITY PROTEIN: linker for activation of T-cells family member 2 [Trichosurus vulpecula]|uniref:LOW QUALITY PROTEIN: linker for activation of T-cells family member 2 n=1 Tax=Trichosurus vulpecula TaxID=9337 RepID=UPI00186ADAC1|nr:LOW QUALITY PROTEIN: linker for activation of T-cells family member 2 [Trichosurus vulpecula]
MSPPSNVSVSLLSFVSQLAGPVEGRMFEGSDSEGDRKPAVCLPFLCIGDSGESREQERWASRSEGSWQAPRQKTPRDMDHAELLGAGVTVLLLGAVAGMCVWCPRLGTRRSKQIFYEQRDEGRQSFAVARAFSIAGMVPEPAEYSTVQCPDTRKDKWLYSMAGTEDHDTSRYQNLRKGSRRESEPSYVDPIAPDYYNLGQFQRQLKENDDDTVSYENILICKPVEEVVEESEDYQNSASIEQWRQSVKVARSPEDDSSEPDYVNEEVGLMK